jgi:hypothetical protein
VILRILVPKAEQFHVINPDDGITRLQACLLRRTSAIHLQQIFTPCNSYTTDKRSQNKQSYK